MTASAEPEATSRGTAPVAAILLAAALGAATLAGSRLPFATGASQAPELVVSMKAKGETASAASAATDTNIPVHMRRKGEFVQRGRAAVRLLVTVDGAVVLDQVCKPRGVSGDAPSIAVARMPVAAGEHRVRAEIYARPDADKPRDTFDQTLAFRNGRACVLTFDSLAGFQAAGQ